MAACSVKASSWNHPFQSSQAKFQPAWSRDLSASAGVVDLFQISYSPIPLIVFLVLVAMPKGVILSIHDALVWRGYTK
jgi:hypothetical protein